jgi:DNA polymerase-3 subunit delta'
MPFADLRGQDRARAHVRRMLASGKLHHGLLFTGPDGVGKLTCARAMAAALACDAPRDGDACGACTACHKAAEELHPDITILRSSGAGNVIGIGEVRELAARLGYPPHEAPARTVILDGADRLTIEASNAFLKTLEEPPARTHFVLVSAAPDRLLVTILSRCQRVLFGPLDRAIIAVLLVAQGIPEARARLAAPLAGGSAARALALAADGELERRSGRARGLARAAATRSFKAAVDAAAELAQAKEEIVPTLDLLLAWYRDAAALAAGIPAGELAHGDDPALPAEAASGSIADLARRAGAVLDAQTALIAYANPTLALERMILAMRPLAPAGAGA